jgi:hypothetical protein
MIIIALIIKHQSSGPHVIEVGGLVVVVVEVEVCDSYLLSDESATCT